ncbi:Hypothetical predicted protein [Podarcis lilfordi]|uniref:Uncharacterized protein n=1 Tax=Podarcis lilfordi TaxID=74358 RepID=A0AA35PQ23_9SAUR|nr:Hypothetical predicted protein [Podarcis lilfordi]
MDLPRLPSEMGDGEIATAKVPAQAVVLCLLSPLSPLSPSHHLPPHPLLSWFSWLVSLQPPHRAKQNQLTLGMPLISSPLVSQICSVRSLPLSLSHLSGAPLWEEEPPCDLTSIPSIELLPSSPKLVLFSPRLPSFSQPPHRGSSQLPPFPCWLSGRWVGQGAKQQCIPPQPQPTCPTASQSMEG